MANRSNQEAWQYIRIILYFFRSDFSKFCNGAGSSGNTPNSSQQNQGFKFKTVGDLFDNAVDKTLNNKEFMTWAASKRS